MRLQWKIEATLTVEASIQRLKGLWITQPKDHACLRETLNVEVEHKDTRSTSMSDVNR